MRYLFLTSVYVDFETYENKWVIIETDADIDKVKYYADIKGYGQMVLDFNDNINFYVSKEEIILEKEEIENTIADYNLYLEKRDKEHKVWIHNSPFIQEIKDIEQKNRRIIQEMIIDLQLYKKVPMDVLTPSLIEEMNNNGYEIYDQKKGKQRFRKRDYNAIIHAKENELHLATKDRIEELKSKLIPDIE